MSWGRRASTRPRRTTSRPVSRSSSGCARSSAQIVNATPGGVLGGITIVLYGMIGLVGAKIWVENGIDFGDPVNLVGLSAGLIAGIGGVTLTFSDNFELSGHRPGHHPGHRLLPPRQGSVGRRPSRVPKASQRRCTDPYGIDTVKPAPFEFARPTSLAEAVEVLAANPDAKVLAGGQSLVPLMSMRLASPAMVVDINGIAELAYVRSDADGVHVGALARHAEVESDAEACRTQPLLCLALRQVAHRTIRNRGTTVGSIVHADAAAEMPAVLALLRGRVTAVSLAGRREVGRRGPLPRPAGVRAAARRDRRRGVLPGPGGRRRGGVRRGGPAPRRLRPVRRRGPGEPSPVAGRLGSGGLPLGGRRAHRRRPDRGLPRPGR